MVAMEYLSCGGLAGLRHSQGGDAVPGNCVAVESRGGCGVRGETAFGRVKIAGGCCARRIRAGMVENGKENGRGRRREQFCVRAVASAYPPLAQAEKTFRLPIDYYQVSRWLRFPNFSLAPVDCCGSFGVQFIFLPSFCWTLGHSWTFLGNGTRIF